MAKKEKRSPKMVSLIIPAYKQERTIVRDIKRIKDVMDQLRYTYEIIIVVDGFVDKTYEKAKKLSASKISIVGYKHNKGKGYAIRFGMARAKGSIIAFIDSGMDINPNGLSLLLEHFEWYNADVIVGSKLHPASKVQYPKSRRILSWGYRMLVRLLFHLSISDTQVGIKFFKKNVLDDVLPRLLIKQYAFDIEVLSVAHRLGYTRIYEAPIELDFNGMSSITSKTFWKAISNMLVDTLAIFYRLKILRYYDNHNRRKWQYDPELQLRVNIP